MPSLQEAAARLTEAAPVAARRYQDGTRGKGNDWFTGASNAGDNWSQGVSRAQAEGSFSKGVNEAGAGSYEEGVRNKGVRNYPTGLAASGGKYARKVQKFTSLWDSPLSTPRGPKRSAQNLQRMSENAQRFIELA